MANWIDDKHDYFLFLVPIKYGDYPYNTPLNN
jgi:hypothetical protein